MWVQLGNLQAVLVELVQPGEKKLQSDLSAA